MHPVTTTHVATLFSFGGSMSASMRMGLSGYMSVLGIPEPQRLHELR